MRTRVAAPWHAEPVLSAGRAIDECKLSRVHSRIRTDTRVDSFGFEERDEQIARRAAGRKARGDHTAKRVNRARQR
jgi:hypothetical protein